MSFASKFESRLEPTNPLVNPLLTDMYQVTMTYAHWKHGRVNDNAVFDLFFRKNPFHGEFCVLAGTDEVLRFLASYKVKDSDIEYLKEIMPMCDSAFFDWLKDLDCSKVKVYAMAEGSVVFPREPLLRVEGPLGITQLLETTMLNLINFPSLIATCAARIRLAAGKNKQLLEFGLRRAQGPDGGLSASKYAYIGGFDGTSNVLAGKLMGMDVKGTHAHAYVMAYTGMSDLSTRMIQCPKTGKEIDIVSIVMEKREKLGFTEANESELAAFISYAQSFPNGFLALVDTYDTLRSGVLNFMTVGWALHEVGYTPRGIRLDSGDLAYLSKRARELFKAADKLVGYPLFEKASIVASNDINEEVVISLNREGHEIDAFGIGTHLVTCHAQPALGCVFKLVEIHHAPRIKISQEVEKLVIPGKKSVYRIFGLDGHALIDIIQLADEPPPQVGVSIMCRHPFQENKRALVTPVRVVALLEALWDPFLKPTDIEDDTRGLTPTGVVYNRRALQMEKSRTLSK
jgi:nicotinate phosphoribosyltransferase